MSESLSYYIVDNDEAIQELIPSILKKYENLRLEGVAFCLSDAICFLKQNPVDIVFIETCLPDIDGLEIFNMMNHVPNVIFITADIDLFAKRACGLIHKGINAFIEKPINENDLVDKMELLLR